MKSNSSLDKMASTLGPLIRVIFVSMAIVLLGVFLISLIPKNNVKRNEVVTNNVPERNKLTGKTQEFAIRGYNFKATTVCLEGKEIMFIFHGAEHQIVNLNKNCEKQNDAN